MKKVRVVFFLPKVTKKLGHFDRISTRVFVYDELLGNAFVFRGQVVALTWPICSCQLFWLAVGLCSAFQPSSEVLILNHQ